MKTKLSSLIRLYSVIALVFVCAGVWGIGEASAASSCNSEYCRVDPSDTLTVDQWSTCYEISNYPPNIAIYIPVKTAPEWVYFYNNLPSNVTKTSCPPPGNNTGAYTGTYTGSYTSGYTSTSGYTGTYTPVTGTYTDTYTNTGTYTDTYTPVTGTYTGSYPPVTGAYTPVTGTYTDTYTDTYTGTYTNTGTYTDTYTGTYTDTYTPVTGTYTDTYTPPQSGYSSQSGYVPEDDGEGCSGFIYIECEPDPDTCVTVEHGQYYDIYTYSPNGFTPDGSGGGTFECGGTCTPYCSP